MKQLREMRLKDLKNRKIAFFGLSKFCVIDYRTFRDVIRAARRVLAVVLFAVIVNAS